jgi:glucose-6-phosphate isomerase
MFPSVNPTQTRAWGKLHAHFSEINREKLMDLFASDPGRFQKYSIELGDILFDYSKNKFNQTTLSLLFELAEECQLAPAMEAMFTGQKINGTENRAVLHTALRTQGDHEILVDGKDIIPGIKKVKEQMKNFCSKVHTGEWKGLRASPSKIS